MAAEYKFPYGNSFLKARVPAKNVSAVLKSRHVRGIKDPAEVVTDSLRRVFGCPPLVDCLNKNDRVVIIVTDNTRACPDEILLPPILAELEQKVSRKNITIIVALGLHPALSWEQLIKKLGKKIIESYHVINHDASQAVNIGVTRRGTPVDVNKAVIEANFRISTGFIEPHFFAGYSGGGKSIAPGVSSSRSIHINHSYKMIEHSLSQAGIIHGNPIHEDIVEQARMAHLDFIVNVLLNEKREITHVVAGDPIVAHEKGCEIEESVAGVKVDHKFDITITTNSGAPLDLDLYQTCKGIDNASRITRDGGIIIIASLCSAGVGPEVFRKLHASVSSPKEVIQKIKREEPIGVQWQNQVLARSQMKNDIYVVSELADSQVKEMMMVPVSNIEAGLKRAFKVLGDDAEVAIVPEGPLVLPLLQ